MPILALSLGECKERPTAEPGFRVQVNPGEHLPSRPIARLSPPAAQNRPTVSPSSLMSMWAAAGSEPSPGIVCICPQIG